MKRIQILLYSKSTFIFKHIFFLFLKHKLLTYNLTTELIYESSQWDLYLKKISVRQGYSPGKSASVRWKKKTCSWKIRSKKGSSWKNVICSIKIKKELPENWYLFDRTKGSSGKMISVRQTHRASWKNGICSMIK